jgi:predicted nucleic acid-binding Zn ribbon protein
MSGPPESDPVRELERDRRQERRLLWKGLLALLVVVVLACVRQRYFV